MRKTILKPAIHFFIVGLVVSTLPFYGFSQIKEGNVWRVMDQANPYPNGNYFDCWFITDSTYVIYDRFSKPYRLHLGIGRIEIPGQAKSIPYKFTQQGLELEGNGIKWVGRRLNDFEIETQRWFREKKLNINPPLLGYNPNLLVDVPGNFSNPVIPIYCGPYVRTESFPFSSPDVMHIEVGLSETLYPLVEIYQVDKRKELSQFLQKQLPKQDSVQFVLFVEEFSNVEDISMLLLQLKEIDRITKIFLAFRSNDPKSTTWLYKQIDDSQYIPLSRSYFKVWVQEGMRFVNEIPRIIEVPDGDEEEDEVVIDFDF
jgi:hypothetical protein